MSDSATAWTAAYQTPLSMQFSRQKYWSELPFPSLGDLPNPGIKPESPALQTDSLPSEPPGKPRLLANSAFALGPSAHEISSAPFLSEVSLAPRPVGLLKLSPTGLQRRIQ